MKGSAAARAGAARVRVCRCGERIVCPPEMRARVRCVVCGARV